jgi:membrane protease YdiL (CAAX protease family)
MKKQNKIQLKLLICFVFSLSLISFINIFTPATSQFEDIQQYLPVEKYLFALISFALIFIVYGFFGFIGFRIAKKLKLPGIFNKKQETKNILITTLLTGLIAGIAMIMIERIFLFFHNLGSLPHPQLPFSFLGIAGAAIGEEIFFRLFLLSFFILLLSFVCKNSKLNNSIAILLSSFLFGLAHLPTLMYFYEFNSLSSFPVFFIIEILLLNLIVGIAAGKQFIKNGLLSAVLTHFFIDIIFHIIYPFFLKISLFVIIVCLFSHAQYIFSI